MVFKRLCILGNEWLKMQENRCCLVENSVDLVSKPHMNKPCVSEHCCRDLASSHDASDRVQARGHSGLRAGGRACQVDSFLEFVRCNKLGAYYD